MFRRLHNEQTKDQQPVAKDENVRKEAQLEEDQESVQPMGNEAANVELMNKMLREANADNELDLSGYEGLEEEIIPYNKQDDKPLDKSEENIDLNNSMYLNSSHNIVNENWLERVKSSKEKNKPGSAPKEQEKKSDVKNPPQEDVKAALEIAEEIVKDQPAQEAPNNEEEDFPPLSTYAPDEDMVVETGRKKKIKKKKTQEPPEQQEEKNKQPELKIMGFENLNEDARWKHEAGKRLKKVELAEGGPEAVKEFQDTEMEKLKDWNFDAVKMKDTKKPSFWRKLGAYTAWGMGKLLSTAFQILTLGHYRRAKSAARLALSDKSKWQVKKDYQTIPGWGGAKFNSNAPGNKDVIADFRRVPTVWSKLTAAKAADPVQKGDHEEEKPLDPIVSVMIDQPKSESAQSMNGGEMGHAFIGIEYSRKSAISNRYERYKLQYGFYPAGSFSNFSSTAQMMLHNARMPGQLSDDSGHKYDVSRRYPAKPEQINAIFNASEKYAEGGYGYYDRNCTTFVKHMVVNTAHLATGGDIFKQSEVEYSHKANAGLFAASSFENNTKAGAKNTLMDLAERDDQTYQNYGNKRVNMNDMGNYFRSQKKGGHVINKTYVPGETAERMRRMSGEGTGEIGSYKFSKPLEDDDGSVSVGLTKIDDAITKTGEAIQGKLYEIFPEEVREQLPFELNMFSNTLSGLGNPLFQLNVKIQQKLDAENKDKKAEEQKKREDIPEQLYINADDLRNAHAELSEGIEKVNILLNNYLKNDARLHQDMLNLISLINYGINYVDSLYRLSSRSGNDTNNITNVREKMNLSTITVHADGKEENFTPTHYESYIQIYKDPKVAVAKYARLKELRKKKKNSTWTHGVMNILKRKAQSKLGMEDDEQITYAEAKELSKLERLEELALEFDNSHNYMIEKEGYNQQDIDYSFQLHDKETKGLTPREDFERYDVNEDVRDNYKSASGIYITIFMEKFFKDLKETWMKGPDEGGLSEDNAGSQPIVEVWLDDYLVRRVKQKEKGFLMIVRGIYRSLKAADPNQKVTEKEILEKLSEVINQTLVTPNFATRSADRKELFGGVFLNNALNREVVNKRLKFNQLVTSMFRICQMEENDKQLAVKKKGAH